MPIHEYACNRCGHHFERLTRPGEAPDCPSCAATELTRRLSTFAVSSRGSATAAPRPIGGGCGSCGDPRGPGACSLPEA